MFTTICVTLVAMVIFIAGIYAGIILCYHELRKEMERILKFKLAVRNDPAHTVYYTKRAYDLARSEEEW